MCSKENAVFSWTAGILSFVKLGCQSVQKNEKKVARQKNHTDFNWKISEVDDIFKMSLFFHLDPSGQWIITMLTELKKAESFYAF